VSGGDREDVPEALGWDVLVGRALLRRRKTKDGIETGGLGFFSGMSLAGARVPGQAVSGVEAA
jgi:hypothetical protein